MKANLIFLVLLLIFVCNVALKSKNLGKKEMITKIKTSSKNKSKAYCDDYPEQCVEEQE